MQNYGDLKDNLESIAMKFEKMNNEYVFMKEKFVEFEEECQIKINFKECHVAICQNGGLIGICKKKGFLDITRGTKINKYIIVMYQNLKRKYLIPIDWNYKEKWVICLEFNEKEQLYAICNDGTIFKIDILTQKAVPKKSSDSFKNENIVKAKLIDNGFIALTVDGNFFYSKDIKNPVPKLIFPMKSLLEFSNNVDFLAIPPSKSKSQKLEVLITNEKGDGVIHIEDNEGEGKFSLISVPNNPGVLECQGASIILKDKVEPYLINMEEKKEPETPEPGAQFENLGKIEAMAISPKKDQLAFYDSRGFVFFFFSNFEEGGKRKKVIINLNNELFKSDELIEHQKILNFEEGCQFLYCGEDAIALCGYRYAFIVNSLAQSKVFKIIDNDRLDPNLGASYCKCISEIDGLRYITNKGIYFISKVPKELVQVCDPFNKSISKKLAFAYMDSLHNKGNDEKGIREIKDNLSKAIYDLQIAAAHIFWTKDGKDEDKRDTQLKLLEAAQHGKCFVKKEEFNFQRFYETCKDIRIVNNLRNHTYKPKMLTYNEYKYITKDNTETKDLIKKIIRSLNFGMAFKISQYLEENVELVYEKYAIACIKKIANNLDNDEEEKVFEMLNDKMKNVPNFSFINLAKKAFKYNKNIIGMKFLDNEKSILTKLPKYIDKEEWDKVLELSQNIDDSYIVMAILEKIFKKTSISDFVKLAGQHPKCKNNIILFLNKNAPEELDNYMQLLNSPEEMFFYSLEQYFQSSKYTDRQKYISLARENIKLIDNTVNPNFDYKFYRSYLDSLENNLKFKIDCLNLDKPIITNPTDTSFDISIYDTYKCGVKAEKVDWIISQNKHFNFSPEGMMLMRLMAYGEIDKTSIIEVLVKRSTLKKLNLTILNLVEVYFKFKKYEEASQYLKLLNEACYFDYKIDMLQYIEIPEIALEVIMLDKNIENINDFVKDIISKKPKLIYKAKALAEKYKVNLNVE